MKAPIWSFAAVFVTGAAIGWFLKPEPSVDRNASPAETKPGPAVAAPGTRTASPAITPELPEAESEGVPRQKPTPERVMDLAEIESLPAAKDRVRAASAAMQDFARRKDFEGLMRFVVGMKAGAARERALANWFQEWVRKDADAALAWAESLADPRLKRLVLKEAVATMAAKQPMRAIALADALTPGERQNALLNAGVQWAQNDPVSAANYFAEMGEAFHLDHTLMHILSHWAGRNPESAKAWVLARANGPAGAKLAGRLIGELGNSDPEALTDLYQRLPQALRKQVSVEFAAALARSQPLEAVRFARGIGEDQARNDALSGVLGVWAGEDPAAAAQWLGGMPAGTERDRLVTQFAHNVMRFEPESAADWAASIGDAGTRKTTLASIVEMWKKEDAEGARAWVAQRRGLTEEERKDLTARLERED